MFWDRIKDRCEKNNFDYEEWCDVYMLEDNRDGICGIRVYFNGEEISIISHKYSYGGKQGLFEILPYDSDDVEGFLSEEDVLTKLDAYHKK